MLGRLVRASRRVRRRSPQKPNISDPTATFRWCLEQGLDTRPQYLWGTLVASHAARALGTPRLAAIEFGVAGGNGLVALERAAAMTTELAGVDVEVFGFDSGTGMPAPVDHRDLPWAIGEGIFPMDEQLLRARLRRAQLMIGPVAETVTEWLRSEHPPIGFVAFDLDYYSSTIDAFATLDAPSERLLPRVVCYFDDVFGYGWSDFAGERAAIADFNASHEQRKIGKVHGLRYGLPDSEFKRPWPDQIYLAHLFDHPDYCTREELVSDAETEAFFAAHRLPAED